MNVSVIIPTCNRKKMLQDCLISVLNQSYSKNKYEIIVVDDGSTDETKNVVKKLQKKYQLKYFYQNNQGPAAARNLGIKNAKGEILAFIDDDCIAHKDWLSNLIKGFNKNKKIAGIGGQNKALYPKNIVEKYSDLFLLNHQENINQIKNEPPHIITCNCVYKSEIIRKIGLFDPSFKCGEDVDLSWRLYFAGYRFLYEPKAIIWHHMPKTITQLVKKCFIYGSQKTEVLSKHHNQLKKRYKFSEKIDKMIISDLISLFWWPQKAISIYKKLPQKHRKEILLCLSIPFLDFLVYRSFRLGMIFQKLRK